MHKCLRKRYNTRINVESFNERWFDRLLKNLRIFALTREFVEGIKFAKRDKPADNARGARAWMRMRVYHALSRKIAFRKLHLIWCRRNSSRIRSFTFLQYAIRFPLFLFFCPRYKYVTNRRIKNGKRGDLMEETGWSTQNYISLGVAQMYKREPRV